MATISVSPPRTTSLPTTTTSNNPRGYMRKMTKTSSNPPKVSKARRERIKRREARLADATTMKLKQTIAITYSTLCKSGSLTSLSSLASITPSLSLEASNSIGSLVSSMTWKYLAPSAGEAGGRDQPINLCNLESLPGTPINSINTSPHTAQDTENQ